jgi:tetratricopeptide (TPR) repeat protein
MQASEKLKLDANTLFKAGDYEAASEGYTKALGACVAEVMDGSVRTDETIKAQIFANRAACALQIGNAEAAVSDCSAAIELNPMYVSALLRRAKALEALGQYERARNDATFVLQIDPQSKAAKKLVARLRQPGSAEPEPEPELEPEPEPEPPAVGAPAVEVAAAVGREKSAAAGAGSAFDESRLLREGEWDEWDQLMEQDEQDDDAAMAQLMEKQIREMRQQLKT